MTTARTMPDWLEPMAATLTHERLTVHGKLRHPRLLGVRYDKDPREVTREQR